MASNLRFTETSRGGKKAILDGFLYVRHRTNKNGIEWRCVKRKECSGMIVTATDEDGSTVHSRKPHTHAADWGTRMS